MSFTDEQLAALSAKLDPAHVKKNPKGFDYVEGWHVIAEMNRIFGPDGWNREVITMDRVAEPYQVNGKNRVAYSAKVRVTVFGTRDGIDGQRSTDIIRTGYGYGSGINGDLNDAHEGAIKEAETDGMKRACMTFGNPFGLALYDKLQANVGVESSPLTPQQLSQLQSEADRRVVNMKAFCDYVGVASLAEITSDGFDRALKLLQKKDLKLAAA